MSSFLLPYHPFSLIDTNMSLKFIAGLSSTEVKIHAKVSTSDSNKVVMKILFCLLLHFNKASSRYKNIILPLKLYICLGLVCKIFLPKIYKNKTYKISL